LRSWGAFTCPTIHRSVKHVLSPLQSVCRARSINIGFVSGSMVSKPSVAMVGMLLLIPGGCPPGRINFLRQCQLLRRSPWWTGFTGGKLGSGRKSPCPGLMPSFRHTCLTWLIPQLTVIFATLTFPASLMSSIDQKVLSSFLTRPLVRTRTWSKKQVSCRQRFSSAVSASYNLSIDDRLYWRIIGSKKKNPQNWFNAFFQAHMKRRVDPATGRYIPGRRVGRPRTPVP